METVALDANNSDNDIEIIREVINTPGIKIVQYFLYMFKLILYVGYLIIDSELGATVKTEPQSEEISTREPDGMHGSKKI